jgi:hypothetical protein
VQQIDTLEQKPPTGVPTQRAAIDGDDLNPIEWHRAAGLEVE